MRRVTFSALVILSEVKNLSSGATGYGFCCHARF